MEQLKIQGFQFVCKAVCRKRKNRDNCRVSRGLYDQVVVWGGIEPPTQGFSVLCSTN
jgi:hypothetical protein